MDTDSEQMRLPDLVEELKLGLSSRATGGDMDLERYKELRKTLLGVSTIQSVIPRFLRVCRTPDDFWNWIKAEYSSYAERRQFLNNIFHPIFDKIEGVEVAAQTQLVFGELIGRGGFGAVFKVRHHLLDMDFAVKVFEPVFYDGSAEPLQRFFREARLLFALNHQSIVRIFDAGIHQGKPFIRMEFCEGKNLNHFLQAHGLLSAGKALSFVEKLTEALVHSHDDARVIHRDLKPSNVILARGERVKLVDFGLGVFIEHELLSRITKTGESAVGGYYTAPELMAEPRLLDPRTDLFSVGALWYTALVGRPPAGTDVMDSLRKTVTLPSIYIDVLIKSLASLDSRFQSAREMLHVVRELKGTCVST